MVADKGTIRPPSTDRFSLNVAEVQHSEEKANEDVLLTNRKTLQAIPLASPIALGLLHRNRFRQHSRYQ